MFKTFYIFVTFVVFERDSGEIFSTFNVNFSQFDKISGSFLLSYIFDKFLCYTSCQIVTVHVITSALHRTFAAPGFLMLSRGNGYIWVDPGKSHKFFSNQNHEFVLRNADNVPNVGVTLVEVEGGDEL